MTAPSRSRGITAAAVLATSLTSYLVVRHLTHPSSIDLIIYRAEGAAIRHDANLYGTLYGRDAATATAHATYPPFAAMLYVPLSYLSIVVMIALGVAANVGLLAVAVVFSMRLVGVHRVDRMTVCLAVAVLLWSEPVFTTLRYGQINLLLLVLVLRDFTRPPGDRSIGVGVGLATGLKVTPAIFICYLALTRRYRAAVTATATFAATIAVSALALPGTTGQFWTNYLFDTSRVGRLENAANQSVRGLLVRMDHTRATAHGEMLLIAAIAIAGLACACVAYRRLGDAWGLPACAVTGLLAAPIAWTHHWVWCVPITIVLWRQASRWLPAAGIFWTFAVWAVPHANSAELHFNPIQIALSNWYVLFGIAFLVLTVARAQRPSDAHTQLSPPPVGSVAGGTTNQ